MENREKFVDELSIIPAEISDLPEILALQILAYQSEAELNNDFNIPPLVQTLEEIEHEFAEKRILKAIIDGSIVGSVRANLVEGTCLIGRVIVHPEWQNCGIGTRLMAAIEAQFSNAGRYELFTSERSSRNLYLYQKLGYHITHSKKLSENVNLIYLEKIHG
jgi:N-acetylglutamate synthase-like GNAT family acetyltransferase